MSRRHLERLAGHYKRAENQGLCIYCGDTMQAWDHFVPVAVSAMLAGLHIVDSRLKIMVPCCTDCNSMASSKLFNSIGAKRRFLGARLKERFKKLIATPDWQLEELEGLGWMLRSKLEADLKLRDKIKARVYNATGAGRISVPQGTGRSSAPINADVITPIPKVERPEKIGEGDDFFAKLVLDRRREEAKAYWGVK